MTIKERILGCMFGGAMGDSLGYPVEFKRNIELPENPDISQFSDDTQMTLFTAEGLCHGSDNSCVEDNLFSAYKWWRGTQYPVDLKHDFTYESRLYFEPRLHCQRAPGSTCLSALRNEKVDVRNDSKGCGGIMRVAPVGLLFNQGDAFKYGCMAAKITHKNEAGYLPAGIMADIISMLMRGIDINSSFVLSFADANNEKMYQILDNASELAQNDYILPKDAIKNLGEGWTGDEALAISIYCCLKNEHQNISDKEKVRKALYMAVEHDGDSDSTGSIVGNIMGACYGVQSLPFDIEMIECNDVISYVCNDIEEKLKSAKSIDAAM